jgi:thiamine pyrophosphate-dependent acetolactate synthase large subunit-like protein
MADAPSQPRPAHDTPHTSDAMSLVPALVALSQARSDRHVVISSMGTAREWPRISHHPLDFHYVPSAMGGAVPLGLGMALARPDREVIVLSGDGSLLMNLGSLVTVVASGAKNITTIVVDNGVYEVTGGQKTAGWTAGVDYAELGRAAGFHSVVTYERDSAWQRTAAATLALPGPRLVVWRVTPVEADYRLTAPSPIAERVEAFRRMFDRSVAQPN